MGRELAKQRIWENVPGRGQQGGQRPGAKRKRDASRDARFMGWSREKVGARAG